MLFCLFGENFECCLVYVGETLNVLSVWRELCCLVYVGETLNVVLSVWREL